jgi:hypothetical protein
MSITIEKILAASPSTTRGQPTQLSVDSRGERLAYAVSIPCPDVVPLLILSESQGSLYSFDQSMTSLLASNTSPIRRKQLSPASLLVDTILLAAMSLGQFASGTLWRQ